MNKPHLTNSFEKPASLIDTHRKESGHSMELKEGRTSFSPLCDHMTRQTSPTQVMIVLKNQISYFFAHNENDFVRIPLKCNATGRESEVVSAGDGNMM